MREEVRVKAEGVGTTLFVAFLVLKLCKVIDWSWWWITAPIWGTIALFLVVMICIVIAKTVIRKRIWKDVNRK